MKNTENKNTKTCPTCHGEKTIHMRSEIAFPGLLSGSVPTTRTITCTTCKGEGVVPTETEKKS